MTTTVTQSRPQGTPGVDIFKIAGRSISGIFFSRKGEDGLAVRQPFTSQLEEKLGLYLEYHPLVKMVQRGDVSTNFAKAHRLSIPMGAPYAIDYVDGGQHHQYLPDYVGHLTDGRPFIAEAGITSYKLLQRSIAKMEAAQQLIEALGGKYWIATEESIPDALYFNLIYLQGCRRYFPQFAEIQPYVAEFWANQDVISAREVVDRLHRRWSAEEVTGAVWYMVAEQAAAGHLVVDLTTTTLDMDTPIAFLPANEPPILPIELPTTLQAEDLRVDHGNDEEDEEDFPLQSDPVPGTTIDDSLLPDKERKIFIRNVRAVTAIRTEGKSIRGAAHDACMSPSTLARLFHRYEEHGQQALVPYHTYSREIAVHEDIQELVITLFKQKVRPSVVGVAESPRLKQLARKLDTKVPSYDQIRRIIARARNRKDVADARSGLKHLPASPKSIRGFVRSISGACTVCQVDEHYLDIKVVASDKSDVSLRVYGAVLICVKTNAPLAAVLSPNRLNEEDYARLIKQAMEQKGGLTARYECINEWPCTGIPLKIFHDRGKIFVGERAKQILVDRFNITVEEAPPYCPSAKGTVEAIFTWMTRKFAHRLPGTMKSSVAHRGRYDTEKEAISAGITFDALEMYFYRAIVDGYMREYDALRGDTRIHLWMNAVENRSVPQWLGSRDDLLLLFMKQVNRKNRSTGMWGIDPYKGISFKGRWYVNPALLSPLRGKPIAIRYDRRDISVIHIYNAEGSYVGPVFCVEFTYPISEWEADAIRKANRRKGKEGYSESQQNRSEVYADAEEGPKAQRARAARVRARKQEAAEQHRLQAPDIHPASTEQIRNAIDNHPTRKVANTPQAKTTIDPPIPNGNRTAVRHPNMQDFAE